jgi:integrase
MAHLKKRGKVWYAVWDDNGRRRAKSLGVTKKAEAQELLRHFERQLAQRKAAAIDSDAGRVSPVLDNPPPEYFWRALLPHLRANCAPNTVDWYAAQWKLFLATFEPRRMADVTREHVQDLKAKWRAAGTSPGKINALLRAMRSVYNHAADHKVYNGPNPFAKPALIRTIKQDRAISRAEFDKLMTAAGEMVRWKRYRDIDVVLALGYYLGLRKGEITLARWEWLDREKRMFNIPATVTKTREPRAIPVKLAELWPILEPHARETGYIYKPDLPLNPGVKYRTDFKRAFQRVVEKAGLTGVTPHSLRHSFATQLLREGVSIAKVSTWLGHSSIDVTVDIYGHIAGYDPDIEKL